MRIMITIFREENIMDIRSGCGYPGSALSNFAPHPFIFRGIEIASMEGFLQGLKFKNPEMQKYVFSLVGKMAKYKGKEKNWKRDGLLYFQGEAVDRFSDDYQLLLDEAYNALFSQNESARKALLATGNAVLEHSIGRSKEQDTILTRSEFCGRLMRIRISLQVEAKIGE